MPNPSNRRLHLFARSRFHVEVGYNTLKKYVQTHESCVHDKKGENHKKQVPVLDPTLPLCCLRIPARRMRFVITVLEGCKDNNSGVPEYVVDPPHLGNNWCKSTGETKGEQPCSKLHKKKITHSYTWSPKRFLAL